MIHIEMDQHRSQVAARDIVRAPKVGGDRRPAVELRFLKSLMWAEIQILRGEVEELRRIVGALEERVECGRLKG